ncbi:MAG: MOSC domain-containing protein [Berryella intestinalis]|uniref:MOSC domain-containing protein n=1 Tax=Berryella intestinalis TaxID=1531429 RepID=UPI002A50E7DF|nr:MOSC domain-containing protein [Berryella intestinalis]MDD7369664.1 MOSC domain-containing protein [Berryella intestinalis]MDY3129654.1 MOSC domain-containing protein [Berryella intestinalis]
MDSASSGAFVRSINISTRKGTRKTPVGDVPQMVKEQWGFENDAHAGDWHRQVSFLAQESIVKAQGMGLDVKEGDFGENFTTEGLDVLSLPLGTQLRIGGDLLVEISQIGKVCHTRCAIYYLAGDCIFPREGIFAVVLQGGEVKAGDPIEVVKMGDGTCSFAPPEALAEVEAARAAGTL